MCCEILLCTLLFVGVARKTSAKIHQQTCAAKGVVRIADFSALVGIPPHIPRTQHQGRGWRSNKQVTINIIDIVRLKDGQYVEHWGQSNFGEVLKEISAK